MVYDKNKAKQITEKGQKELRELLEAIGTGVGDRVLKGKKRYTKIIIADFSDK